MHDLSIYASLFNANAMGFSWRATLDNWTRFLDGEGQISLAINTSTDDTFSAVSEYVKELTARPGNEIEYTITATDIPYTNARFDGLIKDEALKRCNRAACSLLDIDELFPLSSRDAWKTALWYLERDMRYDGLLIPTLDLFHDEGNIKSMGYKFYLHRNHPNIGRGVVYWGDRGDHIDVKVSDTTEAIYRDTRALIRCLPIIDPAIPEVRRLGILREGQTAYIWHTGWLDKQQRIRQSTFWAPHWNNRAQAEIEQPLTEAELDKTPYYPHALPHWNAE